jgi:hypothetical protein
MDQLGASEAQAQIAAGAEPVKRDPSGRLRRGLTASSLTEPTPSEEEHPGRQGKPPPIESSPPRRE